MIIESDIQARCGENKPPGLFFYHQNYWPKHLNKGKMNAFQSGLVIWLEH